MHQHTRQAAADGERFVHKGRSCVLCAKRMLEDLRDGRTRQGLHPHIARFGIRAGALQDNGDADAIHLGTHAERSCLTRVDTLGVEHMNDGCVSWWRLRQLIHHQVARDRTRTIDAVGLKCLHCIANQARAAGAWQSHHARDGLCGDAFSERLTQRDRTYPRQVLQRRDALFHRRQLIDTGSDMGAGLPRQGNRKLTCHVCQARRSLRRGRAQGGVRRHKLRKQRAQRSRNGGRERRHACLHRHGRPQRRSEVHITRGGGGRELRNGRELRRERFDQRDAQGEAVGSEGARATPTFGREVSRRSRDALIGGGRRGETGIDQRCLRGVEQNVAWLHVAVDQASAMESSERTRDREPSQYDRVQARRRSGTERSHRAIERLTAGALTDHQHRADRKLVLGHSTRDPQQIEHGRHRGMPHARQHLPLPAQSLGMGRGHHLDRAACVVPTGIKRQPDATLRALPQGTAQQVAPLQQGAGLGFLSRSLAGPIATDRGQLGCLCHATRVNRLMALVN